MLFFCLHYQSIYSCVCVYGFPCRFKAAPVSLHGLISLCALACILKDSRLLEATLVELSNTLGTVTFWIAFKNKQTSLMDFLSDWQVEEVRILHPSCLQALRVMNYLLMDASSEVSVTREIWCALLGVLWLYRSAVPILI